MAIVRHELNIAAINEQIHGRTGGVARDMLRRGLRVQTAAKRLCKVDTGRLRGSISVAMEPRDSFGIATFGIIVGTNVDYATYVINGTGVYGPHASPIVPKTKSWLVFTNRATGKLVFAKQVKGQKGVNFLRNALPAARS